MKRRGLLFCLVGPAGSGKNSIGERVLDWQAGSISRSVSLTSRAPRTSEVHGKDYFFVDSKVFRDRVAKGDFFEWEKVHDNLYGTLNETLMRATDEGRDLLLIIEIRGACNVKKRFPNDTVIAFVAPPSTAALAERMRARGGVSETEIRTRLATARVEYERVLNMRSLLDPNEPCVDYFVVNDDLARAAKQVNAILEGERCRLARLDRDEVERIACLSHDS